MSDWPTSDVDNQTPLFITSWDRLMGGTAGRGIVSMGAPASAAFPTANLAIYIPFHLPWPYRVERMFWHNGTVAGGNSDIGLYSIGGGVIFTAGSTACSGTSQPQFVAPAITLAAGRYFIALTHSATTANHCFGWATMTATIGRLIGLYQQATALPLPSSITAAQWASAFLPLVGITRTKTGF